MNHAATHNMTYSVNLDGQLRKVYLNDIFMTDDCCAHRVNVPLYRDNAPAVLGNGTSVKGYFMRYSDNSTVLIEGELTDNVASVMLGKACYTKNGQFALVIKLYEGDTVSTIFYGEGTVFVSRTDNIIDPDGVIPSLDELLAKIADLEAATSNGRAAAQEARDAAAEADAARLAIQDDLGQLKNTIGEQELYDASACTAGRYYNSTGGIVEAAAWATTADMDVSGVNAVIYSGITTTNSKVMSLFKDADGVVLSAFRPETTKTKLNVPAGAKTLAFSINTSNIPTLSVKTPNAYAHAVDFEIVDKTVKEIDAKNICPVSSANSTASGVTFTADGKGGYVADGTASSAAYYNVYTNPNGMPDGFEAGGTYYIKHYSFDQNVHVVAIRYDENGEPLTMLSTYFGGFFTIPEDAVGFRLRLYVGATVTVNNQLIAPEIYRVDSIGYLGADKRKRKAMLSIIYDDSHKEFYTHVLPVITAKKVPIASAVISGSVGVGSDRMTWEQLTECFMAGAEIIDHTLSHIDPAERENMTVDELENEYIRGRNMLKLHGFAPPPALVFNGYTSRLANCREAASYVYKAGFNAATGGINHYSLFDPYNINRYDTDGKTLDTLKGWIDELKNADTGWMVWTRHNSNASPEDPTTAAQVLSDAIDYARTNGIPIVPVERGLYEYLDI